MEVETLLSLNMVILGRWGWGDSRSLVRASNAGASETRVVGCSFGSKSISLPGCIAFIQSSSWGSKKKLCQEHQASTSGLAASVSSTPKAPGKGLSGGGELGKRSDLSWC